MPTHEPISQRLPRLYPSIYTAAAALAASDDATPDLQSMTEVGSVPNTTIRINSRTEARLLVAQRSVTVSAGK